MKKHICHFIILSSAFTKVFASESVLKKFRSIEPTIEKRIEECMGAMGVPGAAVAIVIDGDIVHQKAYGMRDIEHLLPMTTETILPVGSLSKSLTAFMVGTLVDDGILSFDDPVAEHIPYFRLQDPYVTYEITIRDYLTHISGYPRHDGAWVGQTCNRTTLISRLKHLETLHPFRNEFLYQNTGYMIVGEAAACATNSTFEELVSERVFKPLGMDHSHFSFNERLKNENRSLGYRQNNKDLIRCDEVNPELINAAGGANSTLKDMTKYLQCLLEKGAGLLSKQTFREITSPQVITELITNSGLKLDDEVLMEAYGLGFFVISYKGEKMIIHGGNIEGHSTALLFFPKYNLGMVVLCNKQFNPFPYIVTTLLVDQLLDLKPTDWIRKCFEFSDYDVYNVEKNQTETGNYRHLNTELSHPIHEYLGTYHNPGYGDVCLTMHNERLICTYNTYEFPLNHWHYDVFEVAEDCSLYFFKGMKISFQDGLAGNITSISIPFEPAVSDIKFIKTKTPPEDLTNVLDKYTGDYSYYGFSFVIAREDGNLVVSAMGQPPFILTHIKKHEFHVEGFDDYLVIFDFNESGVATAVNLHQPNNVIFTATRI